MRPLHAVHLIEDLGPGGAERLLYTNLKHFDPARVRSTVFTVYTRATHWLDAIRELDVPVMRLGCEGPRQLPKAIRQFTHWLHEHPTDVIHSHLWAANVTGRIAGRLARVPVVSSVHNPDHEPATWSDGSNVSLVKRWTLKAVDRWTARVGSDRLIAVSEYVRQSARRHLKFHEGDIELLYNPVDVEALTQSAETSRGAFLRELGAPDDAIVLLHVGRVSPQKGLIYAVRALPNVIARYPSARLVSVGELSDGAWHDRVKREAVRAGVADRVHVCGPRRDVSDLLRACDIFLFPSLYEGFGLALLEAMAVGCACVATDVGPVPEFMRPDEDGILVAPADAEGLANAICGLLADPGRRQRLSANAKRHARSLLQPKPAADRLTDIYEQVARTTGAHGRGSH